MTSKNKFKNSIVCAIIVLSSIFISWPQISVLAEEDTGPNEEITTQD